MKKYLLPLLLFFLMIKISLAQSIQSSFIPSPVNLSNAINAETITLSEVLKLAEENVLGIKLASNDLEFAKKENQYFLATLKPSLDLGVLLPNLSNTSREIIQPDGSITFQRISQNNSSIGIDVRQNIAATGGQFFLSSDLQRFDDFSLNNSLYNGIPIRLGLYQPIFGFNPFKWNKRINASKIEEQTRNYSIAIEDAKWQATQLFFEVVIAKANRNIAATNKAVNENLLKISEERYALGKIARDEILQLQTQLKSSSLQESQAIYLVQNAIAALYAYLGVKELPESSTFETPELLENISLDEAKLIQVAMKNQTLVSTFERQQLEQSRDLASVKANHGIQAALSAAVGFARGSKDLGDIYTDPFLENQVSLTLSLPIIDWGRKKTAMEMVGLQQENLQAQFSQDKLDFETEIRQQIYQFNRLQNEVSLLKEIQTISAERFDISNQRFVLGDISLTDLTLAQQEKDQPQRDYMQSLRAYWVTYYALRKLTGLQDLK